MAMVVVGGNLSWSVTNLPTNTLPVIVLLWSNNTNYYFPLVVFCYQTWSIAISRCVCSWDNGPVTSSSIITFSVLFYLIYNLKITKLYLCFLVECISALTVPSSSLMAFCIWIWLEEKYYVSNYRSWMSINVIN